MNVSKRLGLLVFLFLSVTAVAQEVEPTLLEEVQQKTEILEDAFLKLQRLKVSGYIQGQYQYGEEAASLKVGGSNENPEKSFSRFGIRRGRIKLSYEEGIATGVFQLDITDKGVGVKDVYINIKDPWLEISSVTAGLFNRPFGHEIAYSSSRRETPERSTIFQILFPEERDMGMQLTLQPTKTSPFYFLKLEAGLFAGNGIKQETDSKKDFIGHLSVQPVIRNSTALGLGFSYYNGFVYQGTDSIYKMSGEKFVLNKDASNKGKFAKRVYYGLDAQFSTYSFWGMTQVRGEFLWGKQPGTANATKSPNSSVLPTMDTYLRNFQGGYILCVQDIGRLPFSAILKYDWYDPNIKVSKEEIGINGTTQADLAQNTWGMGGLWRINKNLRLQAYYEVNKNEKTSRIEGFEKDLKDNVFTLRLQYKF